MFRALNADMQKTIFLTFKLVCWNPLKWFFFSHIIIHTLCCYTVLFHLYTITLQLSVNLEVCVRLSSKAKDHPPTVLQAPRHKYVLYSLLIEGRGSRDLLHLCQINHLANKHIKAYHTGFRIATKQCWVGGYPLQPYLSEQLQRWINVVMLPNQQYDIYISETFSVNAEMCFLCIFRRGRVKLGHLNSKL